MRVLTAESMRRLDRAAIEGLGIPSLVLMENAASGVADALAESYPEAGSVGIFCGPGNNGADGLALARVLITRGYQIEPWLVLGEGRMAEDLSGEIAIQLGICRKLGVAPRLLRTVEEALASTARLDLAVDALFGTGLSRPLEGIFRALVEGLNALDLPCLAVDLPSGLSGSSPRPLGSHLRADLTVTFAALKIPLVLPPAAGAAGQVVVTDLGFPLDLRAPEPGDLELLTPEGLRAEVGDLLGGREEDSHKGTYGHVLVVGGSAGKAGAALLATRAALRSGAGLVTAAVPSSLAQLVDGASLESMTLGLPEGSEVGALGESAAGAVLEGVEGKNALALGPGLGRGAETLTAVREILAALGESGPPWVLDADGLQAFAGAPEGLRKSSGRGILTPHPGEMATLLGVLTAEVQEDRLGSVRRAARLTGAVVILKGHRSLVASPDGHVAVNPTGNAGMATGGAGDVLTGILAALLAQGLEPWTAARLGVYLHGLAGDLAAEALAPGPGGQVGLVAGDLIEALPRTWSRLTRESR